VVQKSGHPRNSTGVRFFWTTLYNTISNLNISYNYASLIQNSSAHCYSSPVYN